MLRPFLALSSIALAASPALSATYTARPASPPDESRIVTRDIAWACGAEACTGSTMNSRPLVLCQMLAKKAGRIDGFAVDGRPIAAAELERCNASARPDSGKALANAR